MTLPKKGSRVIDIDECRFRYKVTGNDMVIDVIVEQEYARGQKLKSSFKYHNVLPSGNMKEQERKITPSTIRQLILHALKVGWKPESIGKPAFFINGEDTIPLNQNNT